MQIVSPRAFLKGKAGGAVTYHYSTLGPERFQEFCQALITASFPNAQCLPVGQPDGGRDAFVYLPARISRSRSPEEREQLIFQVKYSREAGEERDPVAFLKSVVKSEIKKIERLKNHGAKAYYLLTNIRGTSHQNAGSVDRMNSWLSDRIGMNAYCWWRDDLDRRLDNQPNVKWSYPEVLKASDLIQALFTGFLGEHENRRKDAVRAYLSAQYSDDEELKFKQVELQSRLLNLFVDLPMSLSSSSSESLPPIEVYRPSYLRSRVVYKAAYARRSLHSGFLAATSFLRGLGAGDLSRIVLEGAPGQGKSTITQYICQVMRMHLLGKDGEIRQLPEVHKNILLRIPFRVDLRDFAKWNSGRNPFERRNPPLSPEEPLSLEGFLAGQVRFHSGGHSFSVSDLAAIVRSSHILIALDGFDEVAEVDLRNQLVEEISRAAKRLEALGGHSIQVVVTSRPAAFAKSEGFSHTDWTYFELLPLERKQVDEYTDKWAAARNLRASEKVSLKSTLATKLEEPHTQFLSRNPMQLTILLALVHTRGPSLPEKRTSLYDTYMDLFFTRESEKSIIVKEHRDLLIDIHRYLAWKLQTAAEGGGSGSIEYAELRTALLAYLLSEGENTDVVSELFDGVIERVGALVSRVQGTFEFEVQPLREYFAARYLYETAPYSPAGDERAGTKLERFDALARNPYWLNVTRFYGGCFSKGEISALVDALIDIDQTEPYRNTSHARTLALMLLGDWVFTQYQPAVRRVITFLSGEPNVRLFLANGEHGELGASTALPERCGRAEFVSALLARLKDNRCVDEGSMLGATLIKNSSLEERVQIWLAGFASWGTKDRLKAASALGIIREASAELLRELLADDLASSAWWLMKADRFDVLASDADLLRKANELILSGRVKSFLRFGKEDTKANSLARFADALSLYKLGMAFGEDTPQSLDNVIHLRTGDYSIQDTVSEDMRDSELALTDTSDMLLVHDRLMRTSVLDLSSSLDIWHDFVEAGERQWGRQPIFTMIATLAAAVRSKQPPTFLHDDLLNHDESLVGRVRFARLRSGATRWWQSQIAKASSPEDKNLVLLVLWTWATPRTLLALTPCLEKALSALDQSEWESLAFRHNRVAIALRRVLSRWELSDEEIDPFRGSSPRLLVFLGRRLDMASRRRLAAAHLHQYAGEDTVVTAFLADAYKDVVETYGEWPDAIAQLQRAHRAHVATSRPAHRRSAMPSSLAGEVAEAPYEYPLWLVAEADAARLAEAALQAESLLAVANRDGWFSSRPVEEHCAIPGAS